MHCARTEATMSLIGLLLVLVILGVALYFVETYVPMAQPMKVLIRVVVVLFVVIWLLQIVGFVGPTVPRIR